MSTSIDALSIVEETAALLDQGHTLAAGMLCRAALERSLAEWIECAGLDDVCGPDNAPWHKRTPARMLQRLVAVRAVEVTTFHELRNVLRILNNACHGQPPPRARLWEIVELVKFTAGGRVTEAIATEDDPQVAFMPTEAEIAAAMQATWSACEERHRRGWSIARPLETALVGEEVFAIEN